MGKILNLNGISTKEINPKSKYYIVKKSDGSYSSNIKLLMGEIDNACVCYADLVVGNLFEGKIEDYQSLNKFYFQDVNSKFFIYAGLSGESLMSRDDFKKLLRKMLLNLQEKYNI